MTDSRTDAAVFSGASAVVDTPLARAVVGDSGSLERLEVGDCSILLYPADALADGAAGLWLRRRVGSPIDLVSLFGQGAVTPPSGDGLAPADRIGRWGDLTVTVRLRLSEHQPAWYWHVNVTNVGAEAVELDLVHAQDVALAPLGAVRTNEYYVSQYLDLTPVEVPGHGVALGMRQNMPGPTPWLLVGCLGEAVGWATDAIQLTGRGRADGAPWPGLLQDLPSTRVQGEHTLAALQTRPIVLEPGETWRSGFYGLYVDDHPEATSADDARHAEAALADPAAVPGGEPVSSPPAADSVDAPPQPDHRSWFGHAAPLSCRPLSEVELDRLVGGERRQVERDTGEVLSFFTADGVHVVTAAKQARVLRPHGHIFRSGRSLLPDEPSICATVWMDGTFCCQLTQGHVSLGAIMSVRRSYLGLAPAHGLRIFVRAPGEDEWALLGTPSAWSVSLDECRWWYATGPWTGSRDGVGEPGLLQVTTRVRAETDVVEIEVEVLDGPPIELLAAAHVPWLDLDGPIGQVMPERDGVRIFPPADSTTEKLFPGGSLHLGWTPDSAELSDDGALFLDERSRGLPWVTLRTSARTDWRLTLTPALVPADPARGGDRGFWESTAGAVSLQAPSTEAGRELDRIATAVPWFTHDALIHYLSPRGLEQYSGGAWGTRDVSQGPVGLLLTLEAHGELRSLLLLLFRAQFAGGDWPQAFDFLERHRQDGPSESHGDVVYWPLLALGQYLAATSDGSILDERVGFAGAPAASVAEHVRVAMDHIDSTLIEGTALPAYGHGDWNDSLQPVDPALAARLCSTWTGVLQTDALGVLGAELGRFGATEELGRRAVGIAGSGAADVRRLLLVDGVLAGYGLFGPSTSSGNEAGSGGGPSTGSGNGPSTGSGDGAGSGDGPSTSSGNGPSTGSAGGAGSGGVEPLIHPRDGRTGLTFSILAMIHAISGDLLSPEEARNHLQLIGDHLLGPDGARLFDRPVGYQGGPMTLFQRAEASTFFGREIGIMYQHAHLRYAEALARVGDGPALLHALALAQPVGITDRVASAQPRQSTCYFSSSDAAFPDRYAARDDYRQIFDGTVPLEGGWRVYSSGPGLFLQLLVQHQLGLRVQGDRVHLDPVLDPELDGLVVQVPLLGARRRVRFSVGPVGHGVESIGVAGAPLETQPLANPYRQPGVSVSTNALRLAIGDGDSELEIKTG